MALQASLPKVNVDTQPYRYDEKADFKGGLNLRADQFNIGANESPAMLNVEVDPRGGVRRRDGVTKINSDVVDDGEIISLISHYEEGQNQVLAAVNNPATGYTHLQWNDDITGNFDGTVSYGSTDIKFDTTQPPLGITFNDYTYIVNGKFLVSTGHTTFAGVRWSGADASTALFTPDIDGSDGHFPNARYVATFAEFVWVAYTLEAGDTHKNRVRFSKVNDAENWTAADYIDIDIGEDGDHITAIIPDADRLLVFKENSIYAIYGFNSDSFEVRNITRTAGCRDGVQPVATTSGIFFWYAEDGIYKLSYDELTWMFERIKPSMTTDVGQPALTLDTSPSMMWFDERLWVSVDYQSDDNIAGSNQNNRRNMFVWDPSLGPQPPVPGIVGAWVRHDSNARSLLTYRPTGDTHFGVAVTSGITSAASFDRISKVNDGSVDVDDYGTGSADEIVSYYQTGWFIGNRPTFPKRWGKTRTVLLADSDVRIYQYIYKDYDLSGFWASYYKDIVGLGSDSLWDTAQWDDDDPDSDYYATWEAEGLSDRYLFARWPTIGTAQAISLRFKVTPTAGPPAKRGKWGVTSIIGMYRTRRLR